MMANTQRPLFYDGFGMIIMNLETYCNVILFRSYFNCQHFQIFDLKHINDSFSGSQSHSNLLHGMQNSYIGRIKQRELKNIR